MVLHTRLEFTELKIVGSVKAERARVDTDTKSARSDFGSDWGQETRSDAATQTDSDSSPTETEPNRRDRKIKTRMASCCSSLLYTAILLSRFFRNILRSGVLKALTWLVPHETAAISARSAYTIQPCTMSLHAKPHL